MRDIRKIARIQIVIIIVFIIFKAIRRTVLENNPPELFKLFLLSFPNFCEAIVGVLTLTMIGLYINKKLKLQNDLIYLIASILAAIFVITQEVKIHNLGGNNIYDPNDVLFSIIGLTIGFVIVKRIKPNIQPETELE